MRLIALAVMSILGLGAGWMLGKTVMGPSRIDEPQPAVSMQSGTEHKSAVNLDEKANDSDGDDKIAAKSVGDAGLEARIDDAQGAESLSQDQSEPQAAAQGYQRRTGRRSGYAVSSQRQFAGANARRGPGMGIVTRPMKAVFKPLKRVNPLRLRLW